MPPTFDDLKTRAAAWLEPIPGTAPAGASATLDPAYQAVRTEIERLNAPAGGAVDWKGVSQKAGGLLQTRTKDLFLAAVLGHSLHASGGVDGLVTGVTLLAEMMERYWDSMQPDVKRGRARVNALGWFLEKTGAALATVEAPPADQVEALDVAARRLAEVGRARLGEAAPAFGPLLEAVARWRNTAAPAEPTEPVPGEAPQQLAPPAAAGEVGPEPESAAAVPEFLRRVGAQLVGAAAALRHADASDPAAYRVLRVGLWVHMAGPPPANGGKTQIQPPAESLRSQLALLAHGRRWDALVEETESALLGNRFALDLHRLTWQGLSGLGPAHERARDAVAAELRTLLSRMPPLPGLLFADGSPLADPQTRTWLDQLVAPREMAAAPHLAPEGEAGAPLAEAQKLLAAGQVPEALLKMQAAVEGGRSGRERFQLRLAFAQACAGAGLSALAKALFEDLAREAALHHIDEWDPRLVAGTLKGLIAAARALVKDPRGSSTQLGEHYERLCRLDPAAAHEVWP